MHIIMTFLWLKWQCFIKRWRSPSFSPNKHICSNVLLACIIPHQWLARDMCCGHREIAEARDVVRGCYMFIQQGQQIQHSPWLTRQWPFVQPRPIHAHQTPVKTHFKKLFDSLKLRMLILPTTIQDVCDSYGPKYSKAQDCHVSHESYVFVRKFPEDRKKKTYIINIIQLSKTLRRISISPTNSFPVTTCHNTIRSIKSP